MHKQTAHTVTSSSSFFELGQIKKETSECDVQTPLCSWSHLSLLKSSPDL